MDTLIHAHLKALTNGELSLGQFASKLGINKLETLKLLGEFNIPLADYDIAEDLETLNELFPNTK